MDLDSPVITHMLLQLRDRKAVGMRGRAGKERGVRVMVPVRVLVRVPVRGRGRGRCRVRVRVRVRFSVRAPR
jgi:hypothetical protein